MQVMRPGDSVQLRGLRGNMTRRVVSVYDDAVAVCREDEYARAKREGRDPISIAFRNEFVIGGGEQDAEGAELLSA